MKSTNYLFFIKGYLINLLISYFKLSIVNDPPENKFKFFLGEEIEKSK